MQLRSLDDFLFMFHRCNIMHNAPADDAGLDRKPGPLMNRTIINSRCSLTCTEAQLIA